MAEENVQQVVQGFVVALADPLDVEAVSAMQGAQLCGICASRVEIARKDYHRVDVAWERFVADETTVDVEGDGAGRACHRHEFAQGCFKIASSWRAGAERRDDLVDRRSV